jgi:surface antigen Omp85-like protein
MTVTFKRFLLLLLIMPLLLSAVEEIIKKPKLVAYPQLSYDEETGIVFGALVLYKYYPKDIIDPNFRNKLQFQAVYTENKQFELNFEPEFNLLKGNTRISAQLKLLNWPSNFYGIGSESFSEPETFTRNAISLELDIIKEIYNRIYLGFYSDYDKTDIAGKDDTCSMVILGIPGSCDYKIVGLGTSLIRDTRDSRAFPTLGSYQKLKLVHYDELYGSDLQFSKTYLDLRYFVNFDINNVIGFQSLIELTHGTAPFLELSKLGSGMRAFSSARYIDNHLFLGRIEYRSFPLRSDFFDRLGFALFLEAGEIIDEVAQFNAKDVKMCYGAGFRFSVFPEDRTNARLDLGFSKDEMRINIGFGEAF